jgi:hypothetical protein
VDDTNGSETRDDAANGRDGATQDRREAESESRLGSMPDVRHVRALGQVGSRSRHPIMDEASGSKARDGGVTPGQPLGQDGPKRPESIMQGTAQDARDAACIHMPVANRPDPPPTGANRLEASVRKRPKGAYPHVPIEPDTLRPVSAYLVDWSPRRVNDTARRGDIPGAMKVGRVWMMTRSAFERWTGTARDVANDVQPPTIEDAAADLRRRGVI